MCSCNKGACPVVGVEISTDEKEKYSFIGLKYTISHLVHD